MTEDEEKKIKFEKMWDFVQTVNNSPLTDGEFPEQIYQEAVELEVIAEDCYSTAFDDPMKIVATISIQAFCAGWWQHYNLEP